MIRSPYACPDGYVLRGYPDGTRALVPATSAAKKKPPKKKLPATEHILVVYPRAKPGGKVCEIIKRTRTTPRTEISPRTSRGESTNA